MSKRVVVEVKSDLHRELRKIAVNNDLKLHVLTNALLADCLSNEEHMRDVVKKLRIGSYE